MKQNSLRILYEDNHLLIIEKPVGVLSQGDLSGDLDVLTIAKQMIKKRDGKPGNVYLGLVHRLDRPVGGVMVIAKTSKAAGRLASQFRERSTKKIYQAVVEGVPIPTENTLTHYLLKDRRRRITQVAPQGKKAMLRYRVLNTQPDRALLEIELITGLSHQIRAQLSAIGHPIIGDRKYGAAEPYRRGAVALYAKQLSFEHPVKKNSVDITVEPPSDWPFCAH